MRDMLENDAFFAQISGLCVRVSVCVLEAYMYILQFIDMKNFFFGKKKHFHLFTMPPMFCTSEQTHT